MTDPNQTVAEFLLARLAEDQAQAERFPNWPIQRVLDDIAAKRRIVERYREAMATASERDELDPNTEAILACLLWPLWDLAEVYADHPDYRHEWAVEPPATSTDTRHVFYNGDHIGEADPSDSNTI